MSIKSLLKKKKETQIQFDSYVQIFVIILTRNEKLSIIRNETKSELIRICP